MWHIVAIGYLFVAVMFSAAQPSIARALIYLVFWARVAHRVHGLVVTIRRRNRRMKRQEQAEFEAARQKAVQTDENRTEKV